MQPLRQPGVRDDEGAAVEDDVRHQPVREALDLVPELRRLGLELLQRRREPVRDRDVPPAQGAQQLVLVVARYAQGVARGDHAHHEPQHAGGVRSPVDEVADEDRGASGGGLRTDGPPGVVAAQPVPERRQQHLQFAAAAVDVADHVERSGAVAQVRPHRHQDDVGVVDGRRSAQDVDDAEALPPQPAEAAAQLLRVPTDDLRPEVTVGPAVVAPHALLDGDVEHDRHREDVVGAGQLHQFGPGVLGHVGRVDDGGQPAAQPDPGDVVEGVEGVVRGGLVVLVVRDEPAVVVAGQHLGRGEVAARERGLAGPGGSDEGHQREGGDLQVGHRVNTASWVGWPRSGSWSPMPAYVVA